jgi:dephospho-CoA kinase
MAKIIAVVGMCGSGKSEAVKFLEARGYKRVYLGQPVIDETLKQGFDLNEKNERKVRESLRNKYGMAAMAILNIDKIKGLAREGNVVIESLYSWEEFNIIKEIFQDDFKLLALYTTKELRYARLAQRTHRPLTKEEAISRDISEIEKTNKAGPIAFADYIIINDSDFEKLKKKVEELI